MSPRDWMRRCDDRCVDCADGDARQVPRLSHRQRRAGAGARRAVPRLRRQRHDRLCGEAQCPRATDRARSCRIVLRQRALLRFRCVGNRQRVGMQAQRACGDPLLVLRAANLPTGRSSRRIRAAPAQPGSPARRAGAARPAMPTTADCRAARRLRRQDRRQPARDRIRRTLDARPRRAWRSGASSRVDRANSTTSSHISAFRRSTTAPHRSGSVAHP